MLIILGPILGPWAPSNLHSVYEPIHIIRAGKNDLGNAPKIVLRLNAACIALVRYQGKIWKVPHFTPNYVF